MVAKPDNFADLIEPFSRRGVDLGLDRLQAALAEFGNPERRFAAVQVAGTNGKGSICTLVHQALLASGIRAGLYTSPHLASWTERIRLGHDPIAAPCLRRHLETATPVAQRHQLTPFELVTAAAFLAFAEANCELVVLEVGLGGRLDATTCHPHRPVIGFASVGLDHAEFLGPDPATIAAEKAGVLQPGAVAISAPQSPEVEAVLVERAAAMGAELRWVQPLDLNQWTLGLSGAVQAANGAVALGLLRALGERGWPVNDPAIRRGFAAARWPGRLQQLNWHGLPLLLDGAHNLPAALALRAELDAHPARHGLAPGPRYWLLGMLANKQGPEIAAALLAPDDRAWIVPVPGHACWSLEALTSACPRLASQLHSAPSLEAGLAQAGSGLQRVVVAGSLYLLGQLATSEQAPVASPKTSEFG
ncbi:MULTISPECIES: folylpolyglutamate synthase/dihydrofolate synthase family protein [unclassified Cyanobium]|uniref:bifunctional folylpolyglutamate synthase/dihydrofolate synthase n=1 Tax=unclassified Cyanobium TaxID=2627006 RepID=UPI0020CFAB07|nr:MULTISPECIES: bifunctional folylpolyglutamate synthase/dihydrofolate synthase [unclassified Cyanobium]MCP9777085.1 bifunctional folylpolyglutamate synthase/dihydrofolate synthase [Cyanobium sp. Tous-M-B4]MCP9877327.1 bifunctional folylpolyglutamate synthase/dihydrofolate synthase [Cyanobium sp. A2C-AMD]